jgi:hypothetical protein
VNARVRAFGPWLLTAAVCTAIVCATAWPLPTGWAAGCAIGAGALTHGVRMLRAETRPHTARDCPACDAGIEHTEHCPTPETHNWGCGCPTDQTRADQMGQQ